VLVRLFSLAALLLVALCVFEIANRHWLALAYVTAACACWLFVVRLARKG